MHAIQLPPQSQLLRAPFRHPSFLLSRRWLEEVRERHYVGCVIQSLRDEAVRQHAVSFWNLVFSEEPQANEHNDAYAVALMTREASSCFSTTWPYTEW